MDIKKLAFSINTVILLMVFGLAGFFYLAHATFLVWFSIPTALVYIVSYALIKKDLLHVYVRLVYFWLTLYMSITTICLGYRFGFHLYCLSMIPIIFYTEYMAEKFGRKSIKHRFVCAAIVICYLLSTGYSSYVGTIYHTDDKIAGIFWVFNSCTVLFFLIFYSSVMLRLVADSEKKLTDIAHTDRLTGLYNRHFMATKLEAANSNEDEKFLAMVDIDFFKKINDTYGHNAGDFILTNVASTIKEICPDSEISRWGGEEFLILTEGNAEKDGIRLLERLRSTIENKEFIFEDNRIKVTLTAGIAASHQNTSVDKWIDEADENLYYGKNNGRNLVILNRDNVKKSN